MSLMHSCADHRQMCTLSEDVPLHDPYGGVVLVVAGRHAVGIDQVPVRSGRTSLQSFLTFSEQLVWVDLCQVLVQVLVWVLLKVQVWLSQGGSVQ